MEEFAERGVGSASYNKIIERSGLSKGTVYYYFDNKDSLLLTVLDEICEMFLRAIDDLRLPNTKEEFWAITWEYNSRAVHFFFENPKVCRVLFWISKDVPQVEQLEHFQRKSMRFLSDLVVRGQEIGAVRSNIPPSIAQRLISTLGKVLLDGMQENCGAAGCKPDGYIPPQVNQENQVKIEKILSAIHDLNKRILAPEEDLACFTSY
jgi:AcrR family transcriptional regulator